MPRSDALATFSSAAKTLEGENGSPLTVAGIHRSRDHESITGVSPNSPRPQPNRKSTTRQSAEYPCCGRFVGESNERRRTMPLFSFFSTGRRRGDDRLTGAVGQLPPHGTMQDDANTKSGDQHLGQRNHIHGFFGVRTGSLCANIPMVNLGEFAPASAPSPDHLHFNLSFQLNGGVG
jgi:hypothetical protein